MSYFPMIYQNAIMVTDYKNYALQCLCFECLLPEVKIEKNTKMAKMLNMLEHVENIEHVEEPNLV